MAARDVFISHSSADAETARELRVILEGAGYSCWMAPDDIVGTRTWTEQILEAIDESKVMIVLVSAAAQASEHVSREVNLAMKRRRALLPIRIENVPFEGPLEYLLSLVQRLDAFPPPMSTHGSRILRRLEAILERPPTTPVPRPTGAATGPVADAETSETPKPRRSRKPASKAPKAGPAGPATPDAPTEVPAPAPPLPPTDALRRRPGPVDVGPGAVVGGFLIESQLGEGGMATVYRARQEEPRRLVALKVIRSDHSANETYRRRFLEEKETLAALEHPSIVPIYAAGEADGVLFIAMRLVDGPDLQARIKRQGHLSLRETVQILEPVADAVDYAHAMGVVHRDLKPSNVILDRDARPYLTDFGLGKRIEVDSQLSLPGMAIGTLDYMAPEQFTGKADPQLASAIDLYALGCVAFQCLTGQPPFVRPTPDQLMYAHAHEAPPTVTSIRPEYPAVIDAIFAKVLAKDPAARYGSAREFVADLDRVAAAAASHVTSPVVVPERGAAGQARSWARRNTALAVGGGAVALVAAVALGAGLVFGPGGPTPGPTLTGDGSAAPTVRPTEPQATPEPPTARPPTPSPAGPTSTPNTGGFPSSAEAELMALQPPLVDTTTCSRFTLEFPTADATLACFGPPEAAWQVVLTLFPDQPSLDAAFGQAMTNVGLAPTQTGCFNLVKSNNVWSFTDTNEVVEGRLGCYEWTEGSFQGVQYVWTYDEILVMGRWLTTDYQTGLDYYSNWVTGARS